MSDDKPLLNPVASDGLFMVCRECLFYRGTLLNGLCRGGPPALIVTGIVQDLNGRPTPQLTSYWRQVPGDEFCGAFVPDRDKVYEDIGGVKMEPPPEPPAAEPEAPEQEKIGE